MMADVIAFVYVVGAVGLLLYLSALIKNGDVVTPEKTAKMRVTYRSAPKTVFVVWVLMSLLWPVTIIYLKWR